MASLPRYLQRFDTSFLPQVFADVLVIGSGVAGHCAALEAAAAGSRVLLLSKGTLQESNTLYAQGGIAAPLDVEDSAPAHVSDTLLAGDGLCDARVVESVIAEGAASVGALEEFGVEFDRDDAARSLLLGREGGHSARRIAHAHGDATGREFQRALGAAVRARPEVRAVGGAFVVDLLTSTDGAVVGALVAHRGELRAVWAGAVVLASGGAGRLFRESTNPAVTTGDGLAMAYRAGAELRDMEFMQFHPTVLYVPGAGRTLLSEAARGEGAQIVDVRGERFLDSYDERGELAPRDVVSRAIVSHILERGDTHVLLDLSVIDRERLEQRLPGVVATGRMIGIDVSKQPLPVRPAAHYTLGGVRCDAHGRTSLDGLLAAGEVTSSGVHGANRLASNSLLEGVVIGRRAGRAAAEHGTTGTAWDIRSTDEWPTGGGLDAADIVRSVESLLWRNAGVQRDGGGLDMAARELASWHSLVLERTMPDPAGMESQNLCTLAGLLVDAAIAREETRGVHWRTDFPVRDERLRGHFVHVRGSSMSFVPQGHAA